MEIRLLGNEVVPGGEANFTGNFSGRLTTWDSDTGNFSKNSTEFSLPPDAATRICLYSLIFLLSIVGNSLVIITLAQNKRMRTVTNVFLLNLAVSDLLLGVFCMPFTLVGSLLRNFIFGEVICRLIPFLQAVSVSVSVWTLVSISLERFFAICRPLHSRRWQTISHAYKVIFLVWLGSMVTMLPTALLSTLLPTRIPGKHKCREVWPSVNSERIFNIYLDVVLLCIPLIIMTLVYSLITRTLCAGSKLDIADHTGRPLNGTRRIAEFSSQNGVLSTQRQKTAHLVIIKSNDKRQASKMRVVRMLFVVVVEFFICWTPLYVINTWSLFDPKTVYTALGSAGISTVHLMAYISSCCNPVTYCFMHKKFRMGFLAVIGCRSRHRWRYGYNSEKGGTMVSVFSTRNSIHGDAFDRVDNNSL